MSEGHYYNCLNIVVSRLGLEPRTLALKGRGTYLHTGSHTKQAQSLKLFSD